MKQLKKIAAVIILAHCSIAYGQTSFGLPSREQNFDIGTAVKIKSVKERLSNVSGNKETALSSMYGGDIDATNENISELASIAEGSPSIGEKVVAIRLLASMFKPNNPPATNEGIRSRLRPLTQSSQKEIAVAAVLRYSRLGFFSDTEALLDYNLNRGFLSKDDVYGELAHVLAFAPEAEQIRIVNRISGVKNGYALDIVASNLKQSTVRNKLGSATKIAILRTLEMNQPTFSVAINEFSLTEAIIYSDWLHAVATLNAELSKQNYDEVVLTQIGGKYSTPKRAISFLASPEGKIAASRIGGAKLNETFDKIAMYARMLPYPKNSAAVDFSNMALALRSSIGR